MSVHRWTNYAGYEGLCATSYHQLVATFCYPCHGPFTDDERCEDNCPIKVAKEAMRRYLREYCRQEPSDKAEAKRIAAMRKFLQATDEYEAKMLIPTSKREMDWALEKSGVPWVGKPNPVLQRAFRRLKRDIDLSLHE